LTSERALWHTVSRCLSPHGKFQRIESLDTGAGIPDVVYCVRGHAGWLELKEAGAWPSRPTTTLNVKHLTLEQVLFAETWERSRGASRLLLQVERDYLLLGPDQMRGLFERKLTRDMLAAGALAYGSGKFPTEAVVAVLTGRSAPRMDRSVDTRPKRVGGAAWTP
jgi:hypothetical protein